MKKYALAGCSGRALGMYARTIQEDFSEHARLVGMFDPNHKKMEYYNKELPEAIPAYTNFGRMMKETKPDCVIVTTIDSQHHRFIIGALEAGADAICEKPMTTDEAKCVAILKAEKKTGRKVYVTFNYRHTPYSTAIKEVIKEGGVGRIFSVDFEWYLDTRHGADYFRRWHRRKENSGGLLVHKATHHFDLINWLIEEDPETVFAFGDRKFYGDNRKKHGRRCLSCRHKKSCEFYWDIRKASEANNKLSGLYLEAESVDSYYRDGCVFSPEIDIEDTMSVNVRYSGGTYLNYSLIAHSPYEGWRMSINGSGGRMELEEGHSGALAAAGENIIRLHDRKKRLLTYSIPKARGGHGGGDSRLLRMLFVGDMEDPLGHAAGSRAGAMSLLIGAAANKSIKTSKPVEIRSFFPESLRRDFFRK